MLNAKADAFSTYIEEEGLFCFTRKNLEDAAVYESYIQTQYWGNVPCYVILENSLFSALRVALDISSEAVDFKQYEQLNRYNALQKYKKHYVEGNPLYIDMIYPSGYADFDARILYTFMKDMIGYIAQMEQELYNLFGKEMKESLDNNE